MIDDLTAAREAWIMLIDLEFGPHARLVAAETYIRLLVQRVDELEAALTPILESDGGPLTYDGTCQFCFQAIYDNPAKHLRDCFVVKEKASR